VTDLAHPGARLVDAATGAALGGPALAAAISTAAQALAAEPAGTVFSLLPTEVDPIVRYVGTLLAGRPVAPLDADLHEGVLRDFVARYGPGLVTGVPGAGEPPPGYEAAESGPLGARWRRGAAPAVAPHPDLAVLLTTSGSTGSPKLVRLSSAAVLANAESIAQALGIGPDEVAVTTLPLFYSYGLSVLHSHLLRGATVVLERTGLVARDFWTAVASHGVTSMAAVPYQYEMLRRLRFDPAKHPTLRTLTQAGGRLRPELIADFHRRMASVGGRFFVMYGQTEAAPRMTTLPSDRLPDKLGSVGPAIPGGVLRVRTDDGTETAEPGVTGEIVYRGPNVMMGYAEGAADLARGDELNGVLVTGDLGHLDEDGYLVLTGRVKRMGKIFGVRVNLDEVERMLTDRGPLAAVPGDDRIHVFAEGADDDLCAKVRAELADRLSTHSSGIEVRGIETLPLLPSGKVDYRTLEGML
jgi:acyl-CoA synthetase (AMP-forming)/AMP-acid ligase II